MATSSSILPLLAALATAGLLAGCCGSQNCDTCDPQGTDDVRVVFSTDTLGGSGFRRAELRGAYVVRYANRDLTGRIDTIRQGAAGLSREPLNFYGSNFGFRQLPTPPPPPLPPPPATGPGSSTSTFNFTDSSYRLVVPATGQQFAFSELETAVELGKSCCACPRNTRRRFVLNGQYTIADGDVGTTTYLTR